MSLFALGSGIVCSVTPVLWPKLSEEVAIIGLMLIIVALFLFWRERKVKGSTKMPREIFISLTDSDNNHFEDLEMPGDMALVDAKNSKGNLVRKVRSKKGGRKKK